MNPKAGEFLLKVLGNPYARTAGGALGGYVGGQLAGAAINTVLPDQFDIDPNTLAGAGAVAGGQSAYGGPGMKLFERAMSKYGAPATPAYEVALMDQANMTGGRKRPEMSMVPLAPIM